MSISTNVFNFTLTKSDTVVHRCTVKNTDETVKDVTGATVKYTIRANSRGGTQVTQKTVGSGVALSDPVNGVIQITLSGSDTALDPGRKYFYDCEVTLSGTVQTVQAGQITVTGEVST